jgi:hypothetical protein
LSYIVKFYLKKKKKERKKGGREGGREGKGRSPSFHMPLFPGTQKVKIAVSSQTVQKLSKILISTK